VSLRRRGRRLSSLSATAALAGLAALGTVTTGCDVSPPAATVNGSTITQSQLDSQLSDIVNNQAARCALDLQGNLPSSLQGVGDGTVSTQLVSYELSTLVLGDLVSQDLTRRHVAVTSSATSSARDDLENELEPSTTSGQSSPCGLTGRQLFERLPLAFSNQELGFLTNEEELAVTLGHLNLGTSSLKRYYATHPSDFAELCLSDIEVSSQAEAQSIRNSIASGGTTFGDAARQNSLDTATSPNGGANPCFLGSELQNPPILSAVSGLAPGQLSQPVQVSGSTGQSAWFLLELNGRPELPFDQAKFQIRQTLLATEGSRVSSELERLSSRAKVNVDPRYGSWDRLRGITAPVPPPAKYVLAPSADVPSGISSALGG
jgi:parvulin-like peptidyl-prolyl isomerase